MKWSSKNTVFPVYPSKMPVDVIGYIYAATVAAGGIIGYVKAGKSNGFHE